MDRENDKSYLLIGVWKLIDVTNRGGDGQLFPPSYGPKKIGLITFNDENRMTVVLCDGRDALPYEGPREYLSYAGAYRFDGETLVTRIDCTSLPERIKIGSDQVRPARLDGNRVTLTAPPFEIDGEIHYRELTWEKIY